MKTTLPLFLIVFQGWFAPGAVAAETTESPPPDRVRSTRDLGDIRRTVETLRGLKFRQDVPAYNISENELRAIVDREVDKEYPGQKLQDYEELLAWLDLVPPHTDIKAVCAKYLVEQVAGLYDSDTKSMCIPSFAGEDRKKGKNPAEKKLEEFSGLTDAVVFAHEFTHALEDQYWPIDDPAERNSHESTDRSEARGFLFEGSATRLMIEALPAQSGRGSPDNYILFWNLLHSSVGEAVLGYALADVWKSSEVKVAGVPDSLGRIQAMPYSYGYTFCSRIQRQWGLDGLDYVYDHPPVSTEQVMHPKKTWEWRDFPVQIVLPESLPGGWKQVSSESLGEAGTAVFFGCQFRNLNHGSTLARGWDGDRAGLYEGPDGHRLLVWASAWDAGWVADRYGGACLRERRKAHQATVTKKHGARLEWQRPDGRAGIIRREGKHVILIETDKPDALAEEAAIAKTITFTEPPEDTARAAHNNDFIRLNPIYSRAQDGDYVVTESLKGVLTRSEENSIGSSYRVLLGIVGESHSTASFEKWQLGCGFLARHESEARRNLTETTVLPWGLFVRHFSAAFPWAPTNTITRGNILWGLGARWTADGHGQETLKILPRGLLFKSTAGPRSSSVHVLLTGFSRDETDHGTRTVYRLVGIPVWRSQTNWSRD